MTTYLHPNLPSKKAFKTALAEGETITAVTHTPWGTEYVKEGEVAFSGPHFPKPHSFYGNAIVKDGKVIKIS